MRISGLCQENSHWLLDYALYMAVKDSYGGTSWSQWDEDIRLRKMDAISSCQKKLKDEILFMNTSNICLHPSGKG